MNEIDRQFRKLRELRARRGDHGATTYQVDVALRAYLLSGYNMHAAVAVGRHVAGKRGHEVHAAHIPWETLIETRFLTVDVEEQVQMSRWGQNVTIAAARTAEKILLEHRLANWVLTMNTDKGVAPRSAELVDRHVRMLAEDMLPRATPMTVYPIVAPVDRSWLYRWRQRWGGRHAKLRVRDPIPQAEAAEKAVYRNKIPHPLFFCGAIG